MKKIGLVLGSGGPKGLAHIGVIKALEEHNIPIDMIAGTSVGAMMGGLYLSMGSSKKVEDNFINLRITEIASMFSDLGLGSGIIKGDRLAKYLDRLINDVKIEDLPKPFAAIATNMNNARYIEITSGSLSSAIRASSSLPGLLQIINLNNCFLIDGGVTQPVPIKTAKMLGADKIIAVNLDQYDFLTENKSVKQPNAAKISLVAIKLLRYSLSREQCTQADVVINPKVADVTWMNMTQRKYRIDMVKRGYDATLLMMDEIKKIVGGSV